MNWPIIETFIKAEVGGFLDTVEFLTKVETILSNVRKKPQ